MREITEPAADLISFKHSNALQQDNPLWFKLQIILKYLRLWHASVVRHTYQYCHEWYLCFCLGRFRAM